MSKIITVHDDAKVFDQLVNKKNTSGPLGWVKAYFNAEMDGDEVVGGDLHYDGPNLVVGQGRFFTAQKIFNLGGTPNYLDYQISHFAVGAGGATVNNDVVTLTGPYICDTGLTKPIKLMDTYLNEPSNVIGDPAGIYTYQGAVKPILQDGNIALENNEYTDDVRTCNYATKVKCTCVIPPGEPSPLITGQSVPISEAGLYFTSGKDVKMFSHVCFAPKWKEFESTLTIVWYILT